MPKIIALIPARAGSKRLAGKNIRPIAGHSLMAYTIAAALNSKIFERVIVSTDAEEYADIARYYGAEIPFLRPTSISGDTSPDIEWVDYTLRRLHEAGEPHDAFSILRPDESLPSTRYHTSRMGGIPGGGQSGLSPGYREVSAASRKDVAGAGIMHNSTADARCSGETFLGFRLNAPWHSSQYQALPEVYIQNASLEIAWTKTVFEKGTIAGDVVLPFLTMDYEGFDINQPIDIILAETILAAGKVVLPTVHAEPYRLSSLGVPTDSGDRTHE